MADMIKRKEKKYLIDASFELELVNGEIQTFPLKLTSWDLAKLADFKEKESPSAIIRLLRNDLYKLPNDVEISDEELWDSLEPLGEYLEKRFPKTFKMPKSGLL